MKLERIEIAGFRGIKRLSLTFEALTALIGENTWGKSSLLDALSLALPTSGLPYQFALEDFHVDHAIAQPQTQSIEIILTFISTDKNEYHAGRYRKLKSLWRDRGNQKQIIYRMSGERQQHNIKTSYSFLDERGNILRLSAAERFAKELMSLHPVIRLKDSRRFKRPITTPGKHPYHPLIEKRINNTCRRLLEIPGHVNKGEMKSSLNAMNALVEHYFSFKNHTRANPRLNRDSLVYASPSTEKSFSKFLEETNNKQTRLLFMRLLNSYLQAKGPNELRRCARPILIIEDPEGRLHPTHMARAWNLLQLLPMQKILTTNSGDLLSTVPLHAIRRLVRRSDKTEAMSIPDNALSRDDFRKVSFHIRFHRSSALFARCWLLVEGETEVWLFSELARQCGYNLMAEGIQIIEFAQSGLRSLIKIAKTLGIDWHVVTDGDAAGKKYATTVRSLLSGEQEGHRLTELPDRDIEHFLYSHGFEAFFKQMIKIPLDHPIPAKKVVARVLKKHAKPDLALSIVSECEKHGITRIPLLLRWTLKRVVTLANGNT